jgi:hypothetical protein
VGNEPVVSLRPMQSPDERINRRGTRRRISLRGDAREAGERHRMAHGENAAVMNQRKGSCAIERSRRMTVPYTQRQGQFLAYIDHYTKVNGPPPSETDMQRHFKVTPPSIHQMVLTLEKRRLIERTPGQARSIRMLVPPKRLPAKAEGSPKRGSILGHWAFFDKPVRGKAQ